MRNKKANKIEALKLACKKNEKPLLIATAVIVTIFFSTAAYIYSINKNVLSWENKVYPGVEVYGVKLGGLDKEAGLKVIEEQLIPKINEKKINITVKDKVNQISYADIAPSYDANSILDEAMMFGKEKGLFDKKSLISDEVKHEITPNIAYDEELLKVKENEIRKSVDIKPVDAKIIMNGTTPSITAEVIGYTLDAEEFHNKIIESINGNPLENSNLSFELEETEARIKASDLNKINSTISTFQTSFIRGSDSGRDKNMEVAIDYINGTVLMPGDVFSYYDKIGETTPEKGYEKANVYVADRIEKDYGGGVCQISTTLYRAAMGANLRSVERRNHSMTVSYAELGLDATYATGYIDYKFKNEYDFPVYIQGLVTSNKVIFNIFGNKEGMGGKTYKMESEVLETHQPKVVRKDDASLYVGEERVTQAGMIGHKVKSYQITYENGKEINREYLATDVYTAQSRIINVGTKPRT